MGLEREAPGRVGEDIVNRGGGVFAGKGLKGEDLCFGEGGGHGFGVNSGGEEEFEFVDALDAVGGCLGGACHPVK